MISELSNWGHRQASSLILSDVDFPSANHCIGAATKKITARKEIIVSGGAFGSPRFLLNSGIGDTSDLKKAGVEPLHHLPDVGKGSTDHVAASILWTEIPPPRPP